MDGVPFRYEHRGVLLFASQHIGNREAVSYIERGLEKFESKLSRIIVNIDGDYAGVTYLEIGDYHPFERIKRISNQEPKPCEVCVDAEKIAYQVRRLGVNESYLKPTTFAGICHWCPKCGRYLKANCA